jgi:hypothetical protein
MDAVAKTGQQQQLIDAEERRLRASRHFKKAMKLIGPMPERAAECERRLLYAITAVTLAARFDNLLTPAMMRDVLAERVETLRKIEADAIHGRAFRDRTRLERERIEALANRGVQPGSRRQSAAKFNAVNYAHYLLADFTLRAPGLTRGGKCHELALILFGDPRADVFDYMRAFKSLPEQPLLDEMLVQDWIDDLLARPVQDWIAGLLAR